MRPQIDRASDLVAQLGECPVWSTRDQVLLWEDIEGRAIHQLDPSTGAPETTALRGRPGSFVLTDRPNVVLVASENELVWLDLTTGASEPWLEVEPAGTGNRLNDGRCDAAGRFVVGSMYEDTDAGLTTGVLHQISPNPDEEPRVRAFESGIGVSNGTVFDAERGRMYFADSPTRTVRMWDYDLDSGERRNEQVFVEFGDLPGFPDGACLDADGCYWSAGVFGSALYRFTPDGVLDQTVDLPLLTPTMPAFGGPDLRTLFVTSLEHDLGAEQDKLHRGTLLAIDLNSDVQGVPEPTFGGAAPDQVGSGAGASD